jgi:hypothetical protein
VRRRSAVTPALPEDAIYPSAFADADGDPCTGEHAYVLRFEKDEIPATDAFWSLTMYDEQGFQIPNELDRFAIGDRDNLAFGADGSLEIYIQHTSPGPVKAANWLPAPKDRFQVMLRIFSPKPEALRGKFALPPLRKVRTASH